jgi:phenylalanyl-tRNA synthetase beta chain
MLRKELASGDAAAALAAASEEVIFKIDIPANRYDMLCLEGIARALNVFRGRAGPPAYALAPRAPGAATPTPVRITVRPETALVRPFIVAAVLRGVALDAARYASLIDLQDKLHQNLCRQRSLVAIGTHDLATLRAPFTYEALPPADVAFVPLKQDREWRADELLAHYAANDQKLRRFVPLLAGSLVVPVVLDADRRVASLPPVINGARSAISLATRDILIECTATDLAKVRWFYYVYYFFLSLLFHHLFTLLNSFLLSIYCGFFVHISSLTHS